MLGKKLKSTFCVNLPLQEMLKRKNWHAYPGMIFIVETNRGGAVVCRLSMFTLQESNTILTGIYLQSYISLHLHNVNEDHSKFSPLTLFVATHQVYYSRVH
jgi:hypothetical protein